MRRERWRKQKEASRENGKKVAQKGPRRKEPMTGAQDEKCILQLAPQMTAAAARRRVEKRKGGSMPFGK